MRAYSGPCRAAIVGLAIGLMALTALAPSLMARGRPSRFLIDDVPQVAQVDYTGCGAAALAMLFGHWGPSADYMEVVDVVRSMAHGTSLPDMARGAHFSRVSSAVSEAYPACQPVHGYRSRKLGYGAFFHAARAPWLGELRNVVAQGYPVAVLTDWKPGEKGPHYRVVTGYDDAQGVLYLNDPWSYGKSLDRYRRKGHPGWTWPYADFVKVWSLSTAAWGLPGGYRYGAVVCAPWKVVAYTPARVKPGEAFTVEVTAEYACPAPFGRGSEAVFPRFPAAEVRLDLELPDGLSTSQRVLRPVGKRVLRAGEVTPVATFTVRAASTTHGDKVLVVRASGRVRGRVPAWGATEWRKGYGYTDVIGGEQAVTIAVY